MKSQKIFMSCCAVVVTFSLTKNISWLHGASDNKTPRGLWAVTRDIYCIKKSVVYFLTFLLRMWKDSIACYPSVNIVKSSLLFSNRSFVYKHCRLGTSANQGSKNKMFANSWDKFSAAWKVVLFLSNSSEKRREILGQNNVRDFF